MSEQNIRACATCVHRRTPAPLNIILQQQVRVADRHVSEALEEIAASTESYSRREEIWLAQDVVAGNGRWPERPRTAPYCAALPDRYLICEVMNPGDECPKWKPRSVGSSDCRQCARRLEPQGDREDATLLQMTAERIARIAVAHPALNGEYQRLHDRIGPMKAFELREAYRSHGRLRTQPRYLESCARDANGFELPQHANYQGNCSSFVPLPRR